MPDPADTRPPRRAGAPVPPTRRPRRGRRGLLVAIGVLLLATLAGLGRLALEVRALRARHASGPSWSFPSRVYADALVLSPGRPLPPGQLRAHLEARGYREVAGVPREPGTWTGLPRGAEIVLRGFAEAPDPDGSGGPERVRVELADGRLAAVRRLGGLAGAAPPDLIHPPRLEPALVAVLADSQRVLRTWTPLARVPRAVRDAVVASEDRRFRSHFGLDLKGNVRALAANVQAGAVRQGASTITQQLARGLFLGRQRTFGRKLAEAALAVGLELLLSKDEILEMYLNSVYWGQGDAAGVAGIGEASRWYFDVPPESLGVAEAALLAGIIPAPNAWSPFRNPRAARARRDAVLADMVATGALDSATAAHARAAPLGVRRGAPPPVRFPGFTGAVRDWLGVRLPRGAAERWGLAIFTTMDLVWQPAAEAGLAEEVEQLELWSGRRGQPLQGAFVALEPGTGAVRAIVGGRALQAGDFNRATQARRQTGSAIKPIVYAAALDPERGAPRLTPASTVPDLRRTFAAGDTVWKPRNDEGEYHPQVTLAKALARSLNVATANLVETIGAGVVARYAERFGLGRLKPVPSIGLGTNEVSLLALTGAYAVFPGRGEHRESTPVRAVVDGAGRRLLDLPARPVRALPGRTADLMTGLLEDVVIYGVAYPLRAHYGFTFPVGGKTGTTNDYNDGWFVGFTPDVAAGVWVGYDTPASLRRPAAQTALPVWAGIMSRLLAGFPPTPFPGDPGLELAWIDPWSGGVARPDCPVMRVPFLPGSAPRTACALHHEPADSLAARDSSATAPPDSLPAAAAPDSAR